MSEEGGGGCGATPGTDEGNDPCTDEGLYDTVGLPPLQHLASRFIRRCVVTSLRPALVIPFHRFFFFFLKQMLCYILLM